MQEVWGEVLDGLEISSLYSLWTWKNSELSPLYRLWDLDKFRTLPSMYSLFMLRKPKVNQAKWDMKHVSIAGFVTGIFLPPR